MRFHRSLIALGLAAAFSQSATAGLVSLDFEDFTASAPLVKQYESKGISVTGNAWGVTSSQANCGGIFAFERIGGCGALMLGSLGVNSSARTTFTLALTGGFINSFSFFYSAASNAAALVEVLDDAGDVLASSDSLRGVGGCGRGISFCDWEDMTLTFSGIAQKMRVTGANQSFLMDDLAFTTPTVGGGRLPEPGSIALSLAALGALGWARKRAARG
jgi:hypothetical protein